MIYTYWVIMSLITLTWLSVQDIRNKCMIDSRLNYLMFGVTLSLVFVLKRDLLYCFEVLIIVFLMTLMLWDSKMFGYGDIEAFAWIFSGFGLIDFMNLAGFFIFSTMMAMIYVMAKNIFKKKEPSAYFPLILVSFMLTSLYFNYFL